MALQHTTIPDRLGTVFAGMDTEATAQARSYMNEIPPSSPCIALFKGGKAVSVLERRHIEQMTAVDIAKALIAIFDEHCAAQGPSVAPEVFDKNINVQRCGSSIPLYSGD